MPGFIASVNTSVHVPIGCIRLYDICFLSGFAISIVIFVVLHRLFPADNMQMFINSPQTSSELVHYYRQSSDTEGDAIEVQIDTKDVEMARPVGF